MVLASVNRDLEQRVDARTNDLRESEQRYRDLVELAPDVIFTIAPDGTFLSLNPAFDQLTGWSRADFLRKSITALVHPDDVSRISAWIDELCLGRESFPIEMRVRTKSGQERVVETIARVMKGSEGDIVGILGINRDISRRREAEHALRASETRYRRLFETAKDGILILDAENGRISDINPYLCDILGYRPDELVGKYLWNLFPASEQKVAKGIFAAIQKMDSVRYEDVSLQSSKRNLLDAEFICNRYAVDNLPVIQCNVRDVREHKEMQRILAAHAQSLEGEVRERTQVAEHEKSRSLALLESIADGVVAVDANGNVTHLNAAAEESLQWKAGDAVGRAFSDIVPLQDEDGPVPSRRHPLQMALATGKPFLLTLDVAPLMLRRTRSSFPVLISAAPVSVDGVVGAVMVFRDITREKELDRAKNEFISIASHQLRTPLATIAWYAEALLSGHLGPLTDAQRTYIQEVARTEGRMNELVNALLNASRIDLGTFKIVEEPVRLEETVDSVLADLADPIASRGIRVQKDYQERLKPIIADKNVVRMVLQNLLSNAVLYNKKNGSVTVRVTINGEAHLSVADTGCGIPRHAQSQVFTKFFRADNAREIEPGGTGLGLYIVRSLLQRVGGSVWFESVENKGSVFHVLLPTRGSSSKK